MYLRKTRFVVALFVSGVILVAASVRPLPAHALSVDAATQSVSENSGSNVVISEFLPNPVGRDSGEWIELHNAGDAPAALDGWFLDDGDGGSTPFALAGLTIPAGAYLVVPQSQSKLVLNNLQDAVRLIAPDGGVRESVSYRRPPEGSSYALIDGVWSWDTTPTPGGANTKPAASPITSGTPVKNGPPPSASGQTTDLKALAALGIGVSVVTEGVVTLPPNRFGTRTFAVQSRDGTAGAIVRAFGTKPLPAIASGDVVRIAARTGGVSRGMTLLETTGTGVVKVSAGSVTYVLQEISALNEHDIGMTVVVDGEVTHVSAHGMRIMDARGEKDVIIVFPVGEKTTFTNGERVEVMGLLSMQKTDFEIDVIDPNGVRVVSAPADAGVAAGASGQKPNPASGAGGRPTSYAAPTSEKKFTVITGAAALSTLVIVGIVLLRKRARRLRALAVLDAPDVFEA